MSYAPARSCNKDLFAGMTDGSHKKGAPNRGGGYCDTAGSIEHTTCFFRAEMSGLWHGYNEEPIKVLPDGRKVETPYTMAMIVAKDMENV
jgi:hypothetical protein